MDILPRTFDHDPIHRSINVDSLVSSAGPRMHVFERAGSTDDCDCCPARKRGLNHVTDQTRVANEGTLSGLGAARPLRAAAQRRAGAVPQQWHLQARQTTISMRQSHRIWAGRPTSSCCSSVSVAPAAHHRVSLLRHLQRPCGGRIKRGCRTDDRIPA